MEYRPQRAPDTPSNAASMSTFKRRKRPFSRSPTILGRIVRLLGILTVVRSFFLLQCLLHLQTSLQKSNKLTIFSFA